MSSSLESLSPVLLGLHQLRGQVVGGLAPAQFEQLLEIGLRHRVARRWPARSPPATAAPGRAGARRRASPCRTTSRCSSGMPSMSQMMVTGRRNAKSSIRSMCALRATRVERLVDHLLDARAHVLDAARGEGLHHEAAQTGVVRRVLLQHPVAHAAEDRLVHDLATVAANGAVDIILAETLVAHHEADIGVAARHERAMRVDMHGVGSPQSLVMRIGIPDEIRRQRIEQRIARAAVCTCSFMVTPSG